MADVVLANPAARPEAIALTDSDGQRTYAQLAQRIHAVARFLGTPGSQPGDRVALLLPNGCAFVETQLGCALAGHLCVPLNLRQLPEEQQRILRDAQATVLFVHARYVDRIAGFRDALPGLHTVVMVGQGQEPGTIAYDTLFTAPHNDVRLPAVDRDSGAVMLYTSGTTSAPKGAVLTHANYLANLRQYLAAVGLPEGGVNLQLSPMFHAAGIFCLVHLLRGARTVFLEKVEPAAILDAIERERVTFMFTVPTVLYQLLDQPDLPLRDITSLQRVQYGAAPITGSRLHQAMRVFGQRLQHSYGMTEGTSHVSILLGAGHETHAGSVGQTLPGVELRVVDDEGREVATDEIGELIVSGPNVFSGYWRQPVVTLETLRDGWLHTGDLGRRDAQGFIYVIDRKKDMIISGGANIYPSDIEDALMRHPAVAECAVFGVPDELWGEAVAAAVVLRAGHAPDEAALIAYLRGHLGGYKVPKKLWIMNALPKNATGKILKRELRVQCDSGDRQAT
nr:long-chain-fatty-acid--CoA ligase [Ramlibacter lithotrophicus]